MITAVNHSLHFAHLSTERCFFTSNAICRSPVAVVLQSARPSLVLHWEQHHLGHLLNAPRVRAGCNMLTLYGEKQEQGLLSFCAAVWFVHSCSDAALSSKQAGCRLNDTQKVK